MPKSVQPKAKAHLKDIWLAETKATADTAFDFSIKVYGVKYDRAVKCLTKDRIETTFATVRHRTAKTKGCLSRQTALAMTHQLMLSAEKNGAISTGRTACRKSSKELNSETGSSTKSKPPDHNATNFRA